MVYNKFNSLRHTLPTALFLALLFPLSGQAAEPQIYLCKDANGRTITSDQPIPECANRSVKVMSKDGTVRREIPPPPTREQLEAKKQAEEQRKIDAQLAKEQKLKDEALLSTYRTEKEIEAARERTIAQLRTDIIEANNAADNASRKRRAVQTDIDKIQKRPIPPALQRQLDEAEQAMQAERKRADKLEADMLAQKTKFDAIAKRFRELNGIQEDKAKTK